MKITPRRKRENAKRKRSKERQRARQPPPEVSNSHQVDDNRVKYPMRESVLISEKQHFQRMLHLHWDFIVIDLELRGKISKERQPAVQVLALMMLHIGRRKVENAYQQELQQSNQRFFPYFPFVIYLT